MDLKEFHLFPKLPPELRLEIWAFASPDPVIVVERSIEPNPRYRNAPALLHARSESRNQYLGIPTGAGDGSVRRSQRTHSIFKLYHQPRSPVSTLFEIPGQDTKTTRGCYFSLDDIFCLLIERDSMSSRNQENIPPPMAPFLQHFALEWDYLTPRELRENYPALKTFTLLHSRDPDYYDPEDENASKRDEEMLEKARVRFTEKIEAENAKFPEWTPPVLTARFTADFLGGFQNYSSWVRVPHPYVLHLGI